MKNRHKKNIIFILLLFFLLIYFNFVFAQTKLEIEYPGFTPKSNKTILPEYVKYIYDFIIIGVGLTALWYLIEAGLRYFTSAGDEEKIKDAKKQIGAVFKGTIILLLSYLILITINPQLISFQLPGLSQIPEAQLPQTPLSPFATSDLLGRIGEMAKVIKEIPDEINSMAERIQELTDDDHCKCENTQSLCFCTGGGSGDSCQPRQCYAGPGFQPCPDETEIKENQKRIIVWKDEILYYKNRALSEVEDLRDSIEEILNEEISWYNQKITAEQEFLAEIPDDIGRERQQKEINDLIEQRDWLTNPEGTGERDYKENLEQKLIELANAIAKVEEPVDKISQLPDECLINVKDCDASCKGGCHDIKSGCEPDTCSGGNPCPINEIQSQVREISPLAVEINSICDEVINIIDNIRETKEKEFQL